MCRQESQLILQNWATCPNRPKQASAMPKPGSCEPARRSCRVCFAGEPSLPRWPLHPSWWSPSRQPTRTSSQCSVRVKPARLSELSQPSGQAAQPAGLDQLHWLRRPSSGPGRAELAARSMGLIFPHRVGHKKTNQKDQPQGAATQKIN